MAKARLFFCFFLIAVAAFAIYSALGWTFKAALFPLSVSIPLLILAAVQLFQLCHGPEETIDGATVDLDFSSDVPPEVERQRVINTFSWIVGFIVSVYLIGFPLTVPLFIFSYLKFQGDVGWLRTVVTTAITWSLFYVVFQRLVHLQFESGALQNWLGL